jgi:hypothetical protein
VVISTRWQFLLIALAGAVAYLALLKISYGFLEGSYFPPQWWRDHWHLRPLASASWFVLVNAAGAVMAAMPVAVGVVLLAKTHRLALGLIVGAAPSIYVIGSSLAAFGLPNYAVAWVVVVCQFLSIGLAVLLTVVLFGSLPLTIGSSDRGSRLR